MIYEQDNGGRCRFHGIHPVLEGILRTVALDPWELCPEGSARLLPMPGADEDLVLDWQDHVQPELRHGFGTARETVAEDLAAMSQGEDSSRELVIPPDHADAWLITLNALRLALATCQGLTEEDLSRDEEFDFSSPKGLALVQVNLFAFMQECLIRSIGEV